MGLRFRETEIAGVVIVDVDPIADGRGLFARTYCEAEFARAGLPARWPQCNVSWNARRGTLRGMHYQAEPHEEPKLVRCTRGRIFDVAVDLRRDSRTFKRWVGVELGEDDRRALYLPRGIAHGFQTLTDGAEVFYQMGESYKPEASRGVRFDDPAFAIAWPLADPILSERDAAYPDFGER